MGSKRPARFVAAVAPRRHRHRVDTLDVKPRVAKHAPHIFGGHEPRFALPSRNDVHERAQRLSPAYGEREEVGDARILGTQAADDGVRANTPRNMRRGGRRVTRAKHQEVKRVDSKRGFRLGHVGAAEDCHFASVRAGALYAGDPHAHGELKDGTFKDARRALRRQVTYAE
jgi:hypothetical protein